MKAIRMLCALTLFTAHLQAQDNSNAAGERRLQQLESIYQQQLRSLHVPLLGKYLTELQRLAASAPDPAPYQREISRIQEIIAKGGVVDLNTTVQALKTPAEMPAQPVDTPPPRLRRKAIALTPALAASILPRPFSSVSPEAAAIGEIQWRIEVIPPGTYDVILHYSYPETASQAKLTLDLSGQKLVTPLGAAHITSSDQVFRILRMGRLNIGQEIRGGILSLSTGNTAATALLVKQLIITPNKDTN